jgi:hypothetical protein
MCLTYTWVLGTNNAVTVYYYLGKLTCIYLMDVTRTGLELVSSVGVRAAGTHAARLCGWTSAKNRQRMNDRILEDEL